MDVMIKFRIGLFKKKNVFLKIFFEFKVKVNLATQSSTQIRVRFCFVLFSSCTSHLHHIRNHF